MAVIRATSSTDGVQKSDPVTPGQHRGVCIGVTDLGTQDGNYGLKRKYEITFEIPDDLMMVEADGQIVQKPKWISKQFTRSMHEKAGFRKAIEMWRGAKFDQTMLETKGFDPATLLGVNATLHVSQKVSQKGNTYAVIDFIVPPTGESVAPVHDTWYFDMDDSHEMPDALKGWAREDIKKSPEWINQASPEQQEMSPKAGATEDDIPF